MNVDRETALRVTMATYLGECCRFCGKEIATMEELETVVYAGYHDKGRIAHKECWDAHPQEVRVQIEAQRAADRASAPRMRAR